MKKLVLIILLVRCIPFLLPAQEDTLFKPKIYKTWITMTDNTEIQGVLYEIEDSAVLITNSLLHRDYEAGNFNRISLDFNNIGIIKTRNKNSIINRSLTGFLAGFAIGGIIGLAQGDDPPCTHICIIRFTALQKAGINGTIGAVGGAGLGALSGLIKIKIPINGSIQTFNSSKSRLRKYSYIH